MGEEMRVDRGVFLKRVIPGHARAFIPPSLGGIYEGIDESIQKIP